MRLIFKLPKEKKVCYSSLTYGIYINPFSEKKNSNPQSVSTPPPTFVVSFQIKISFVWHANGNRLSF